MGIGRMDNITLLIADDEPNIRIGLRALAQSTDDIRVIDEVVTGYQAVQAAARLQPDVILMDINMPDEGTQAINGIEATRRILSASPHIAVLMLTMFDDEDSIFAAMRAGARGYLLKGSLKAEILRSIRAVYSGEVIFGAGIAQRMMRYFGGLKTVAPDDIFPELTDREREILTLIAQGFNNADIASRLVLSGKTVRNHISNIFSKLQVADRAQAIVRARQAGLGEK